MKKRFAVLGGDQRQIHLARLLHSDGWDTVTWGLEKGGAPFGVPLDHALDADIIVLPLPVCRGDALNLPLTDMELFCDRLWESLRPEQISLGGMTGSLAPRLQEEYGLELLDYYDREEVQIANAVSTAEGAVMRAMKETEETIQGSRCLIIGYGRIGKVLAHRLHGLGAEVTVAARKRSDLAWIGAYGCHAVRVDQLKSELSRFDLIFNTAPGMVLDADNLRSIKSDCVLMELASLPGGIDMGAVKELGLRAVVERGLPGKVAPLSAAVAIRDGIYHILEEKGVL